MWSYESWLLADHTDPPMTSPSHYSTGALGVGMDMIALVATSDGELLNSSAGPDPMHAHVILCRTIRL
jgi:hypothetical protein